MEGEFRIQGDIAVMRESVPIRFVHHKNMDRPENHVLHINSYLELYVFAEGNHQYIVEDRLYELQRGDIVLIHPREVHKALPLEPCRYERFYLLLDTDTFAGMASDPLKPILKALPKAGNRIRPDEATRQEVLELLQNISHCVRQQDSQLGAVAAVLRILDICTRQLQAGQPEAVAVHAVPELLEKILAFVAANTASIQTTAQIAGELGLTPQYLSAYFSQHIGTPLKIYVQAKKIALAKDLLDSGADVTQACFDSGFNDCSYFIRVFKKYVGMTPLRYRQRRGL